MTEFPEQNFYAAGLPDAPRRPALAHEIETEVCVIGGGFAGLWAARALAAHGKEVVLLEANEVASGASGQNGGFVSAGYAAGVDNLISRVGLDHARDLYSLSREGVEIVRSALVANSYAAQAKPGRLHVLRYNDEIGLEDEAERMSRDFGHDLELWPKTKVRSVLRSEQYYQALLEPDAFHLNPIALARILASEIEDRGGRIFEQSRVLSADLDGLRKSLVTESGRIRTFEVVLAGSAAAGISIPWIAKTIMPIRTHVAVTAPLGKSLAKAIRYEGAVSDTRRACDYYRLIGDRLLWGGRISARAAPPRNIDRLMAKDIARVYPQLAKVPIEYAWSGVMGYAVHMMPQIGMVQPGVWISSAFGGQGLNTSAVAGDLIASAVVDNDDRWRLFQPFGLVWNGGVIGRSMVQVIYWGMQAKDRLDEAQTRAVERDEAAVDAGLAPGLAAHTARKAKKGFLESRVGRVSVSAANILKKVAIATAQPFIQLGRFLYKISLIVGRALTAAIWWLAGVVAVVARTIGRAMELMAVGLVIAAKAIARASVFTWRRIIVPSSKEIAAFSIRVWEKIIIPASKRFASGTHRAALLAATESRKQAVAFGNWSAKKASETKVKLAETRKQYAEAKQAASEAAKKRAEEEKAAQAKAAEEAAEKAKAAMEEDKKKSSDEKETASA